MSGAAGTSVPLDLVGIGEVMVEIVAEGPLGELPPARIAVGGDTFNVVATAAALGSRAGYVGLVGDDATGAAVIAAARRLGVDTAGLVPTPGPTGLYVAATDDTGERSFTYYRSGSVAGRLDVATVSASPAASARAVHASGITLCLSSTIREAALHALRAAHERGVLTSYDINFRPALCGVDAARRDVAEAAPLADVLSLALPEAELLGGVTTVSDVLGWAWSLGATSVLVSLGADGAVLGDAMTNDVVTVPSPQVTVVDTAGAGDALLGAYLHSRLTGMDAAEGLVLACATAARAVTARGALGALA